MVNRINQELADKDDTFALADRLMDTCKQVYYTSDNKRCELSIKIGLTQYPNDSKKPEVLLNNCDIAQGFLFAKPMPMSEFLSRFM